MIYVSKSEQKNVNNSEIAPDSETLTSIPGARMRNVQNGDSSARQDHIRNHELELYGLGT